MFVKTIVVLYELRLKRLATSHEAVHLAHMAASSEFHGCCDKLVAARKQYDGLSSCVLRAAARELIDAAGGRRSASEQRLKKCERAEAKADRKVVRIGLGLAKMQARLVKVDAKQQAPSTASPRSALVAYSAALQ